MEGPAALIPSEPTMANSNCRRLIFDMCFLRVGRIILAPAPELKISPSERQCISPAARIPHQTFGEDAEPRLSVNKMIGCGNWFECRAGNQGFKARCAGRETLPIAVEFEDRGSGL